MIRGNSLRVVRLVVPCLLFAAGKMGWSAPPQAAVFTKVVVGAVVVEPEPFPKAPSRPDEAEVIRQLTEVATARAERTLVKQHIAETVERSSSRDTSSAPVLLTGTVRLPVSLPNSARGRGALFQHGHFATVDVALQRRDGTMIAKEEVTLGWRDVPWVLGSRISHARPLDDVLGEYVRKGVDHAVKGLKRHDLSGSGQPELRAH